MRTALLLAPLLLTVSGTAFAQSYSQPGTEACNPSCWTSHYGAGSGFRAFDNFTLAAPTQIGSVAWQGIYIPQTGGPAPSPSTVSWTIGFFADSGNFPGTGLASYTFTAADVVTTQIGTGDFGGQPVNLYGFSVALPTPVLLAAGTQYWFSPLSQSASFDPFFSWSPATALYDNYTAQTDTNGNLYSRPNDRAFALTAVPEPATWAMMIGGMALAGGAARRRRTGSALRSA